MRRRICFFDLDGTLLSHQSNRIPPSTIQAFTLLQAQKIPCILCSGRSLFELDELQQTHVLHFDGSVLLTGAYAVDAEHKRLFDRSIGAPWIGRFNIWMRTVFRRHLPMPIAAG